MLKKARKAARKGAFGEAAELYGRHLDRHPGEVATWVQLGHSLKEDRQAEAAEAAYRRAVALAPHDPDALRHLAHLLLHRSAAEAAPIFRRLLAIDPDAEDARAQLASLEDPDGSAPALAFRAALEMGPVAPAERTIGEGIWGAIRVAFHRFLARRAARARRFPAAIPHYRAVLRLRPYLAAEHVQLGHALKESGDGPAAASSYRRAIGWAPATTDAHRHLGYLLKDRGDTQGAAFAFLTALRLQPSLLYLRDELSALGWSEGAMDSALAQSWSASGPEERTPAASRPRLVMPAGLARRERVLWHGLASALALD